MNKQEILNNSPEYINGKRYFLPIAESIRALQKTLQEYSDFHNEEFIEYINKHSNKILQNFSLLKKIYNNDTEKLLPIVIDFLNNMMKIFNLKIFYNLTPSISYPEYEKMETGEQILNNIFDGKLDTRSSCIIQKKYIRGGNCHHRSIAIKKIFDQIQLDGVECKIHKVPKGHSFITVEYKGRTYMFDILKSGKFLDNKEMNATGDILAYKILNPDFSDLGEFNENKKFAKTVEQNHHHSIKLEIDKIKIEIEGHNILVEIKGEKGIIQKKFDLNRDPKTHISKAALIEQMFPMINKSLPRISSKITMKHLKDVFEPEEE